MTNHTDTLSPTFNALADATRRAVMARLTAGAASVGELAGPFAMALPTFLQHLKVLEAAGLIATEKQGRRRMCRLQGNATCAAEDWLAARRTAIEAQTSRLQDFVESGADLDD